jgi:hypothetical protein
MSYSNISATLKPADIDAIAQAVEAIRSKLPFGITLSPEERMALPKLGTKSGGFVADTLAAVQAHPDILPGSFDKEEFEGDAALFESMLQVYAMVAPVAEMVEQTTMAVGSEAFAEARQVYQYVKTAAQTTPGLQSVAGKLGERFQQTRSGKVQAALKPV